MRFFIDPTTWIDHLGTRDFVFGTRIHGNVAALMAGTPAVALPWDSRTSELCDFHSIPHRRATPELMATVDAAELYAEADFGPFNAARAGRRAEFVAFLGRNGLAAAEELIVTRLRAERSDDAVSWALIESGPTVTQGESDNYAGLVGSTSIAEAEKQAHALGPSGYDPAPWIRRLTTPVLWLYGGRDRNQPAGTSMEILRGLSAGRDFVTVLFPSASHSLFDEKGFPPDLFVAAAGWLQQHGLA